MLKLAINIISDSAELYIVISEYLSVMHRTQLKNRKLIVFGQRKSFDAVPTLNLNLIPTMD